MRAVTCVMIVLAIAGCSSGNRRESNYVVAQEILPHKPLFGPDSARFGTTLIEFDARFVLRRTSFKGLIRRDEVITRVTLLRGQRVGFERGEDGEVIAVAGGQRTPLPDGFYQWLRPPTAAEEADTFMSGLAELMTK